MAEKKEEAIIITITGPDGDERDYAQDVSFLLRGKNSPSWSPFRHQKMTKKSRISFWHASIPMKMEKQNTSLRRMMNMMQSQISMMRCEKHYKRGCEIIAP